VNVELGGLARTDNSGWGDEFERLAARLLAGADAAGSTEAIDGTEKADRA
jgi:cytochrome c biogenesis protein